MMMADVGGIENVNGSKIAIPLAPPKPGKTPIITPSVTPININMMLKGVSATAKPLNSALSSSTVRSSYLFSFWDECVLLNANQCERIDE
jgi:hypothetical protein